VRHLDAADLAALRTASETSGRGTEWATAVHEASWAVHIAGRIRPAAAAQFALVEALHAADLPLADAAGGTWNLLSGALHAVMVRDLLDAETTHRLLGPVIRSIGVSWAT
jgi:NAD(P)-dependent dehydrogenase (short-subunit alcohol dehydrogenase family)